MGKLMMRIVRYHGTDRYNVLDCVGMYLTYSQLSSGNYALAAVYFVCFFFASVAASVAAKLSKPESQSSSRL